MNIIKGVRGVDEIAAKFLDNLDVGPLTFAEQLVRREKQACFDAYSLEYQANTSLARSLVQTHCARKMYEPC